MANLVSTKCRKWKHGRCTKTKVLWHLNKLFWHKIIFVQDAGQGGECGQSKSI